MIRELYVFCYLPGQVTAIPAGLFTHNDETLCGTFEYGRQYRNRPNAMALDPISLPLGLPAYPMAVNHEGLYGVFRDALPDWWGRQVYAHHLRRPPETMSNIDFLLVSNATRVGNLDFRERPDSPEPQYSPPDFTDIEHLLEAATAIEQGRQDTLPESQRALIDLLAQGTSIGGARPKATVRYLDDLWIAKFPGIRDDYSYAKTEYAAMRLAERCGIAVPEMLVMDVGGRDVFLSKRFDRARASGGYARTGYVSALTVLDLDETDRDRWSYLHLADTMRQIAPPEDLRELYARIIYNVLVRNTDDHPRNHGFLFLDGQWKLSPAFDITPTRSTPGTGAEVNLAMAAGKHGKVAAMENLLSACERFGLDEDDAQEMICDMSAIVQDWRTIFAECGVSEREMEMFAWGFDHEDSPLNQGLRLADDGFSPGF